MNKRSIVSLLVASIATTVILITGCGGLPGDAVAKVGDVYIKSADYTSQVTSMSSQYGITLASDPTTYKQMAAGVLETLVATEIATQKAADLGLSVTDAETQAKVDSIATDYYDGDQAALESALKTENMTMDDLKKQIKDYLLTQLVHDKITGEAPAATDAEIAAYYEANKTSYQTTQTYDARHILIAVAGSFSRPDTASTTASEATTTTTAYTDMSWAKAMAAAAQIRVQLLAGASWAKLAAQYSDDKGTKNIGGSLGAVTQGALVATFGQEFDDALFGLELNQVSEPIKTANGYHVIQVTKITEPRQMTLEEAKAQIAQTLLEDAQTAIWTKWIDQAKKELKVVYRSDLKPAATTTTEAPTTTVAPAGTATTAKP